MDIPQEIAKQVEQLPPDMQARVLHFVVSLASAAPKGEKGTSLRQFSGTLDHTSAREMMAAIEAECEQVDNSQW